VDANTNSIIIPLKVGDPLNDNSAMVSSNTSLNVNPPNVLSALQGGGATSNFEVDCVSGCSNNFGNLTINYNDPLFSPIGTGFDLTAVPPKVRLSWNDNSYLENVYLIAKQESATCPDVNWNAFYPIWQASLTPSFGSMFGTFGTQNYLSYEDSNVDSTKAYCYRIVAVRMVRDIVNNVHIVSHSAPVSYIVSNTPATTTTTTTISTTTTTTTTTILHWWNNWFETTP
jgi:hypothetical protein